MLRWCLVIFAADGGLSSARLHQSISASSRGSDSEERVGGADAVVQQDPTTSTPTHLQQRQHGHLRKRGAKYAAASGLRAPSPGSPVSGGLVEENQNKQKSSNGAEFDAGGGLDVTFTKDEEAGAGEEFGETDPDEVAAVGVEGDASFLGGCCGDDKPESGDDKPEKAKSETEEESDSGAGAAPDEKSDEKPEPAPAPTESPEQQIEKAEEKADEEIQKDIAKAQPGTQGTKASVKAELKLYVPAQLSKRLAKIAKKLDSFDADQQKELAELNEDEKAKRERIKRRLDNFMLEADIKRETELLEKKEKELDSERNKKNKNKIMVEMAKSDRDNMQKRLDDNKKKAEHLKLDLSLLQTGKLVQSTAFKKGGNGRAWVARVVRKIAVKTEPVSGSSVVDMNEGRGVPLADHFLDVVGELIEGCDPEMKAKGAGDFDEQCAPLPDDTDAPAKKSVEAEVEEALLEYMENDFAHTGAQGGRGGTGRLEHKKGKGGESNMKRKEERKR
eukprot:CAMPEP_0179007632 /NCGR_PEP_ID=MMETSP0795-20121207/15268_1 /TAXON_ID=88552 /ORGANISM="Amoebophrya sp., Strain Ameob2" /LENGTH=502 /DNA_ID=CAMNT_0020702627 /DNA_START=469 /DNA_END=1977 /DNA_ORIENTATION=-